jgi:hypothetical protein
VPLSDLAPLLWRWGDDHRSRVMEKMGAESLPDLLQMADDLEIARGDVLVATGRPAWPATRPGGMYDLGDISRRPRLR